jgi:hypothetical protein
MSAGNPWYWHFLFQKQTKYQWRFDGQPKKEIETPGCNDTSIKKIFMMNLDIQKIKIYKDSIGFF